MNWVVQSTQMKVEKDMPSLSPKIKLPGLEDTEANEETVNSRARSQQLQGL